jgi:hypothetical protein
VRKNKSIVGKANEFPVDYSGGSLFTCCESHILECEQEVSVGSIIECDHCGKEMVLTNKDGKLMWRAL